MNYSLILFAGQTLICDLIFQMGRALNSKACDEL